MSQPARAIHAFEKRAMGSPLRLSVVEVDPGDAADAWIEVAEEFEAGEQAMSRFRETSDLMVVNRAAGNGSCASVDRRLGRALAAADRAGRLTDGRFDARVLADLERLGYSGVEIDSEGGDPTEPGPAGGPPPWPTRRWLSADPRASRIGVDRPVDLGGIGKGLALRWAWRRLRRTVIDRGGGALLEAGGDLVAGGPAPQDGPWIIAIEDPAGGPDPIATRRRDRWRGGDLVDPRPSLDVHDGRPAHHLLDPRTGSRASAGLLAVTVAGTDPAWAEVWSKTPVRRRRRRDRGPGSGRGLAAWWVRDDGRLEMTAAGRARTTWVAAEG